MKGVGASSRIFELLDARPLTVNLGVGRPLPVTTPPRRLIFDNVRFAYPSRPNTEILKGVNLTIEPGECSHSRSLSLNRLLIDLIDLVGTITSIAGGSGSGKSTLANLLIRYYDPQSGRILYGDDDIRSFTPESWRKRIAVVPQDPALFSTTIAENSASSLGPKYCRKRLMTFWPSCSCLWPTGCYESRNRRSGEIGKLWFHRFASARIRNSGWSSRRSIIWYVRTGHLYRM